MIDLKEKQDHTLHTIANFLGLCKMRFFFAARFTNIVFK
jgi:hypothetical protein